MVRNKLQRLQRRSVIVKNLALEINEYEQYVETNPLSVCEKLEKILFDIESKTELKESQELLVRFKKLYDKAVDLVTTSCMEKTRSLFIAISENELGRLQQFSNHQDQFPTYSTYNTYLNNSVRYVKSNILNSGSLESCALATLRWTAIMKKCADQYNFESARLIIDALQSQPISRLNLDSLLSEKTKNAFQELNNLFGIDAEIKNFPDFRKELQTSRGMNAIPLRGMLKKDLEFLTTGRDACEDVTKIKEYNQQINGIIESIKQAQASQKRKSAPKINHNLWTEKNAPNEDKIYELSYKIVPLGQKASATIAQIKLISDAEEITTAVLFRERPTLNPTPTYRKFRFNSDGKLIEGKARMSVSELNLVPTNYST